jgi:hypothetical protein
MKNEITAVLVVALLVAVLVAASLGASYFADAGNRQTVTTTSIRNMTSTVTVLATSVTTSVATSTTTLIIASPWNDTVYLMSITPQFSCEQYGFPIPCYSDNLSTVHVFNCAQGVPTGCNAEVSSASNPRFNFNLTIWYPLVNQSGEPTWANCEYIQMFRGQNIFGYNYAYCISVSQTSFIIAEQAGTYQ